MPPSDPDADRLDLGSMDLPAHHPERPARGGADRPDVPRSRRPVTDARPRPGFAHASEAELARILDFYEVAWQYEPQPSPSSTTAMAPSWRASARTSTCPTSTSTWRSRRSSSGWCGRRTASCAAARALSGRPRQAALCPRLPGLLLKYGRIAGRRPERRRGPVDAAPPVAAADGALGARGVTTASPPAGAAASPEAHATASPAIAAGRADHPPEVAASSRRARRARRTRSEARARLAVRVAAGGPETTA